MYKHSTNPQKKCYGKSFAQSPREFAMIHSRWFLTSLLLILTSFINGGPNIGLAQENRVPEKVNDQWETAAPESEGLDPQRIGDMVAKVVNQGAQAGGPAATEQYTNISSVVIVRNGKLVVEEYFPRTEGDRRAKAFRRVALQEQASVTKSVTSILIGIAIDQSLISGVDEKISALLPEYADIFSNEDKDKIRVRDLLSMQAGLSWDEWTFSYTDERNDHVRMMRSDDPVRYVLEQQVVSPPGTKFAYNSGISIVLGKILSKVSGKPVDKFAEKHLFEPLGISDFYWSKYPDEIVQTGGGLFLRPRDMAKIGYLYLNGGRWQQTQVVSEKWISESTKAHVDADQIPKAARADGYGYQWWLSSFKVDEELIESYGARGRGGQFILVLPKQEIVAVFTSPPDNPLMFQPLDMVQKYLLPAVKGK
jgi:CubicO group peptidase (beta-lactamase class C family)